MPARKKRVTAITKGCADSNPIFVAADADDQRNAKPIPAAISLRLFADLFFNDIWNKFSAQSKMIVE